MKSWSQRDMCILVSITALFTMVTIEYILKSNQWWNKLERKRRKWQTTPVSLPGESHAQRRLMGCCSWGCKELGMTEWSTRTRELERYMYICYILVIFFLHFGSFKIMTTKLENKELNSSPYLSGPCINCIFFPLYS